MLTNRTPYFLEYESPTDESPANDNGPADDA
jgi:hypothetical protein